MHALCSHIQIVVLLFNHFLISTAFSVSTHSGAKNLLQRPEMSDDVLMGIRESIHNPKICDKICNYVRHRDLPLPVLSEYLY